MGIRFLCPNGHKLNVKGFLAGKRGICPECDTRFLVPMESGGRVEALEEPAEASESPEPAMASPRGLSQGSEAHLAGTDWHIRSASGDEQGPIPYSHVKMQIAKGDIDKDSWVWRTGWLDWQRANDVFPEIESSSNSVDAIPTEANSITIEDSGDISAKPDVSREDASGFVPEESVAVATHRRLQRERRQRARIITFILTGLICLLALVLVIILSR